MGQKEEAAKVITELRKRALTEGHEEALKVTPDMITLDFILDEYMRELSMEGFRWYTLKRTGKLLERALKYNPDVKDTNFTSYRNMINNFKTLNIIYHA